MKLREKRVIISEIGQSYDAPDDRVFENFTKTAFKNQPMGRPILGTKETVSSFKQSDLKFFLDSNYTPENMVVSMSGNLNKDHLFKMLKKNFQKSKKVINLKKSILNGLQDLLQKIET